MPRKRKLIFIVSYLNSENVRSFAKRDERQTRRRERKGGRSEAKRKFDSCESLIESPNQFVESKLINLKRWFIN